MKKSKWKQRNCSRDRSQNITFKRQNKRNNWNRKKNVDETLKIIEEILDYSKNAQKNLFGLIKLELKIKESVAKRVAKIRLMKLKKKKKR